MPAYFRSSLAEFLLASPTVVVGKLEMAYAHDTFTSQFVQQTRAWEQMIPLLQRELQIFSKQQPVASDWTIILEFPLYRLRKRLDIVLLSEAIIIVIEVKIGERRFRAEDMRQVEEYALDLRDFHAGSQGRPICPILWCTEASHLATEQIQPFCEVAEVKFVGKGGLAILLAKLPVLLTERIIVGQDWDEAPYRPVPNIIEAATSIFAGHSVRSIAQFDATNLKEAASRAIQLIIHAKEKKQCALIFLTGVPGSGKTLAGLHVVHDAIATGAEQRGDIIYLSGNTPLVTVLREALSRDEFRRNKQAGSSRTLNEIRRGMRARIQHINDFLKQSLSASHPPHEHAIVFDEAQRAWDLKQGKKKFDRETSEPSLLLELMGRHGDWCACLCLVGGGQEINSGEEGFAGWGDALRELSLREAGRWCVYAPLDVLHGGESAGGLSLGPIPNEIVVNQEPALQLQVPLRSFRSPDISKWVGFVLNGDWKAASTLATRLGKYPILVTRSLAHARKWLKSQGRGQRRYGLVASSRARRLRADGLGIELIATDGAEIAHWYINPPGDIRSSFALEVTTNQYTCQGLELDYVGVCWGGDLVRDKNGENWKYQKLSGNRWHATPAAVRRLFLSEVALLV